MLTAYSSDASGLQLVPEAVARPESIEEVIEMVRMSAARKTSITPAGAQTSTTASSITDDGLLLSLRSLDKAEMIESSGRIRCGPGAIVADAKRVAAASGFLLPLDPTSEEEATIGGATACNASGARSLRYGPIRRHVTALSVVLPSGELVELRRNVLEKNTVGYGCIQDPVDWFIGSEGTLGVIVSVEIELQPLPPDVIGFAIAFDSGNAALDFVVLARESGTISPRCLEYFDERALVVAREADPGLAWLSGSAALYAEQETAHRDASLQDWLALVESTAGIDDAVVLESDADIRRARKARHSIPAAMSHRGASVRADGGRRVSTDWAVPYRRLGEALQVSRRLCDAAGVDTAATFGHAGNGHPHQNFIARDAEHLVKVEKAVEDTLKAVIEMGGTFAAEHGVGKIKRKWLGLQLTPAQIGVMRAVKRELDPQGIMSPGNIF